MKDALGSSLEGGLTGEDDDIAAPLGFELFKAIQGESELVDLLSHLKR